MNEKTYLVSKKSIDCLIKFSALADKKMFDATVRSTLFSLGLICFINTFIYILLAVVQKNFLWFPIIVLSSCGTFALLANGIMCRRRPLKYFIEQSTMYFDQLIYEADVESEINTIIENL